ncbi:MAG: thioredoxin-disulfide reductase [Candidatus Omnitrophica bacterium]|nr:thioredoxin-disulfide reductase [Candidatus Omnitrophota bacterium]
MNDTYDCIIIGASAAGLTAGIYTGRALYNTLILERLCVGGQIILTERIENYPGFPEGIGSFELAERLRKQAEGFGVRIEEGEAIRIGAGHAADEKQVFTADREFRSRALIIASGASPKKLGIPGESELSGKGVSYCATCDGPLYRGKEVIVIGGGDKAIEEALFLSRIAKKVTIVHRRDRFRASRILQKRAEASGNIHFALDSVVEEITGSARVEAVKITNVKTGKKDAMPADGVFIFVGILPNTEFAGGALKLDKDGFILTDELMNTGSSGIFACGDCRRKDLYQFITACGDGAQAGFSAVKYLEGAVK